MSARLAYLAARLVCRLRGHSDVVSWPTEPAGTPVLVCFRCTRVSEVYL